MLLQLDRISKRFGSTPAVCSLSLEMEHGEILCLLGPSGCGKTTTLRMIAGFEIPDQGSILFASQNITRQSPQQRQFGMVFQSYALFPHMSVFENVAFGLKVRSFSRSEILSRVNRALELVQLAAKSGHRIQQISGGEQQRVAVARAIVIEPRLLLLDEPLSNLDASLRESTRTQLRQLIRKLQISAVFVTHDQEEAFTLADRIAVLNAGVLQQVGRPAEIYDRPSNLFVSRFVGKSNILRVQAREGSREFLMDGNIWKACEPARSSGTLAAVFRPQQVRIGQALQNSALIEIVDVQRTVHGMSISSKLGTQEIEIWLPAAEVAADIPSWSTGKRFFIHVPPETIHLFSHE
ncbi:MAG: ABC transporter ATP-binding protein [Acidobacteria bacterium]|nr:ABC transporter ATP-binding protein [Acidobacteriota bacterium]